MAVCLIGSHCGLFAVPLVSPFLAHSMQMMGLSNAAFWWSWVLTYLVLFAVLCVVIVGVSARPRGRDNRKPHMGRGMMVQCIRLPC